MVSYSKVLLVARILHRSMKTTFLFQDDNLSWL